MGYETHASVNENTFAKQPDKDRRVINMTGVLINGGLGDNW